MQTFYLTCTIKKAISNHAEKLFLFKNINTINCGLFMSWWWVIYILLDIPASFNTALHVYISIICTFSCELQYIHNMLCSFVV